MPKQAISVTLEADNLTWLKGRVGATGLRSVSQLLDRLVSDARTHGGAGPSRSVVGTVATSAADPMLDGADAAVRALFAAAAERAPRVSERRASYRARPARKRRRG
jgi:hypothetical protein